MLLYLIKRLLLFLPTLWLLSVLAFFLSKAAPGDPVERYFEGQYSQEDYQERARFLHLDKPAFYFSISAAGIPGTPGEVLSPSKKRFLKIWASASGNLEMASSYYEAVETGIRLFQENHLTQNKSHTLRTLSEAKLLLIETNPENIKWRIDSLQAQLLAHPGSYSTDCIQVSAKINNTFSDLVAWTSPALFQFPSIRWNGFENQYHLWFSKFIRADFGHSLANGKPVKNRIQQAIFWTLVLNSIAILIAFGVAIPLGVFVARKEGSNVSDLIMNGLYLFYSLPVFWVATLLVVFFTTREYGMDWFAGVGLGKPFGHSNIYELFWDRTSHLLLPIFCLVYPSLAFITRQMQNAMSRELQKDYIRTARAKGLTQKKVIWKHAFKNAVFPIITLIGTVLPASIAGSVAIEVVFNIPGMGKLMVDAILQQDWPIVYAILLLGSFLTILGLLLSDLLYAAFDPRVRLGD